MLQRRQIIAQDAKHSENVTLFYHGTIHTLHEFYPMVEICMITIFLTTVFIFCITFIITSPLATIICTWLTPKTLYRKFMELERPHNIIQIHNNIPPFKLNLKNIMQNIIIPTYNVIDMNNVMLMSHFLESKLVPEPSKVLSLNSFQDTKFPVLRRFQVVNS